jgi:hypothetical protein
MVQEQLQQGLVELGRRLYTDELRKERRPFASITGDSPKPAMEGSADAQQVG